MIVPYLHRYTEKHVEIRILPAGKQIWTRDADEIEAFARQWDVPGQGVYFGVATRKDGEGNIAGCCELPAVYIDLDGSKPVDDLLAAYMPPSLIVDSGGGLHAYWVLTEPLDVSMLVSRDTSHPAYRALIGLQRMWKGDPAVCDVARVLRLPGTRNHKRSADCHVLHQSNVEYDIDDIIEWVGEPTNPFQAAAEQLGVTSALDPVEMLAGMEFPGNVHDTQLRVSAHLQAKGKPTDQIVETVLDATKRAAGPKGERWDWKAERRNIEQMVVGAQKKFNVVNLNEERAKRTDNSKEPAMVRIARVAMEAWKRPLVTVDGELWTYGEGVWSRLDEPLEHRLRSYIQGACEQLGLTPNGSNLNGAYRWILERPELAQYGIEWDAKPVIVGTNGTYELATGTLREWQADDLATRKMPFEVGATGPANRWVEFLNRSLDPGVADCLQEWFGAMLMRGKTRELRKGLLIYGPSRTGKTQIADVARALLGGNTAGVTVKALSERFGMQALIDRSGWVADDAVGRNESMDAEAYKVIVTGESTSVERKNKTPLECSFEIPVLLTMNAFPRISDNSDAVYNRTLAISMTNVITEQAAVPIAEDVIANEMPQVLAWAIEGAHRLKARGYFDPPEAMVSVNREFKDMNNPFREFADICLEQSTAHMTTRVDVRRCFNNWMQAEIESKREWSGKAVAEAVKHELPSVIGERTNAHGRVWLGVKFTEAASQYLAEYGETRRAVDECNHIPSPEMREKYGRKGRKKRF